MVTDIAAGMWRTAPRSPWRIGIRRKSADVAALYEEFSAPLLGYLRAQGAPDPEDLLGEVFYQVARDVREFSGNRTDQRRWVFGIARARMIDAFLRRSARPVIAGVDHPEPGSVEAQDATGDSDIALALAGLTEDQREVIALRFVADLSVRDTAAITRREVRSVEELEHEGLAALRRVLADGAGETAAAD